MSQWMAWAFKPSTTANAKGKNKPKELSHGKEKEKDHSMAEDDLDMDEGDPGASSSPSSSPSLYPSISSSSPSSTLPPSSPSPSSSPHFRELSPSELLSLQKENFSLRNALQQMAMQIAKQNGNQSGNPMPSPSAPPMNVMDGVGLEGIKGYIVSADKDYQKVREEMEKRINSNTNTNTSHPNNNITKKKDIVDGDDDDDGMMDIEGESHSSPIHHPSDAKQTYDRQPIVILNQTVRVSPKDSSSSSSSSMDDFDDDFGSSTIPSSSSPPLTSFSSPSSDDNLRTEVEEEVAIIDIPPSEWWTIINPNGQEDEKATAPIAPSTDQLDDDFVVLKHQDFSDALADFITKNILSHHPEAKSIPSSELKQLIDHSFQPLKTQSTVQQAVQWGKFMYSTYGWGQFAFNLYREPYVAKIVATGVFQAASWILVFIV